MARRMKPTSGGMHDVLMSAKQLRNNTAFEKKLVKGEPVTRSVRSAIRRAAKKQIKTREERAARKEQA